MSNTNIQFRIISIITAIVMLFAVAGCAANDNQINESYKTSELTIDHEESESDAEVLEVKADELAMEFVKQLHPKNKGKYRIVKSYESNFMGKEVFIVNIEYRTENSTAIDYPFDVSVMVDKVDGSTQINSEKSDLSGIETIGNEKAIEMAKGYIADEYSIDRDKLEFVSIEIIEHNAIEYDIILEYGDLQYTCGLLVDTGELDSIQRNTKQ